MYIKMNDHQVIETVRGEQMKAHKYEDVQFIISQNGDGEPTLNLVWKEGGLFLSLNGLILNEGDMWYEIPVSDLMNVNVINEDPLQLRFTVPSLSVVITGKRAERLLALRHFLLPYIGPTAQRDGMKALIKFWAVGVHDVEILSKLLGEESHHVISLVEKCRREGYIDKNDRVSETGLALLKPSERRLLERLD